MVNGTGQKHGTIVGREKGGKLTDRVDPLSNLVGVGGSLRLTTCLGEKEEAFAQDEGKKEGMASYRRFSADRIGQWDGDEL